MRAQYSCMYDDAIKWHADMMAKNAICGIGQKDGQFFVWWMKKPIRGNVPQF